MVEDWTKEQADQITGLYKSLNGGYQKEADNLLFGGPQLPYEQAQSILTDLLKRQEIQEHGNGGLENSVKAHSKGSTPLMDLGVLAASAGLAVVASPIVGIIAGSVYLMSKYYSSQPKPSHP